MQLKLAAIAACAITILVFSGLCGAQDARTCRERNIEALMDKVQRSNKLTPQESKLMLLKLKHQLKAEKMLRERRKNKATQPVNLDNEPFGVSYPEWMPDEQEGN
jgi:hypothetical protein